MSSTAYGPTPQARIRDAALHLFGQQGFAHTTVRQVAERAGVSAGLVIHHFGSKEELRRAVDAHVMDKILSEKTVFLGGNPAMITEYIQRMPEFRSIMVYLLRALRDGGPIAGKVFDDMCAMTDEVSRAGEAAGMMRLPADREAAIVIMVAFSLGVMMLEDHVARHLGGTDLADPRVFERYGRASLALFTHPVLTDDSYLQALDSQGDPTPQQKEDHD